MMTELSFRIVLVPKEEKNPYRRDELLTLVKCAVEMCGLKAVDVNYFQIKKSEDEDYPEIEELIIGIRATTYMLHQGSKVMLYENFCSLWKTQFSSLPYSYIELFANDSFAKSKISHHTLSYRNIAFGVLPHNGMFYQYADLRPRDEPECEVHFYHDTRNVVIETECVPERLFKMHFSYENIRNIFVSIDCNTCNVYFDLFNPPIVFEYYVELHGITIKEKKSRSLNFGGLLQVDILGRANIVCLSFEDLQVVRKIISCIHYECSGKSVFYSSITSVSKNPPNDPIIIENMHFGCAYLVTAIFKRNFVVVSQALDVSYKLGRLHFLSEEKSNCLERALISVLAALDSGKILNFWDTIEKQYQYYETNQDEIDFKDYIVPPKCCMIRRITLTPTRQLLWPSEIMLSNRVLRKFNSDYSVRISFREDNMCKLSSIAPNADPEVLEACIRNPMKNGIRIGSRTYQFLAWSNSQIRDHGIWMYAKDEEGETVESIREWMGDFSHIRSVPKYMARMGQCFSQTEDGSNMNPLDPTLVRFEDDIEGGWDEVNNKPYCFSDGIGKISTELAVKVRNALGHDKRCSAFQIRYGGCKGVLVVDPTLKDAQIVFRKSMKKFDCQNSNSLEIAKVSAPSPLQLNRPFITLLNGLGVRHRMFLRLQENMIKTLTDMLFNEDEAAKFLKSKTPTSLFNFEDLSKSGIHLTTEPFFKSLLLALHRHFIENIKLKANVAVDPSKGRNMLGVLDETRSLHYGQVFIQYTNDISLGETTEDTTILKGEVLVTKHPCMFPGDVRKFTAVDIPSLRHIVDCIVFPQTGPRPHPNEMTGSDLDGDEYAILWAHELIFYGRNQNPADFPALHSPDETSDISVDKMIDFLEFYIKSDQVGAIANAHLAQAHTKQRNEVEQGIFSKVCLSIAKKFSIAVDFAKNGCTENLGPGERPFIYPDFMEKEHHNMFKCKMALGKMYRVCKDFESENEATCMKYENIEVDSDLVYDGWENYKTNAMNSRNKYNALLRSVLRNYGIQHEAEALSGAFSNLHCRFHERKDRFEIEKVIIGCIKKLNKSMFQEFMEEFETSGGATSTVENMLRKASAWYIVTYSDPVPTFLSFPWSVSKFLADIKIRKTSGYRSAFSPLIMNLDKTILECESKQLLPHNFETTVWSDYRTLCDRKILRRALGTLMLWAQDNGVIQRPDHTGEILSVGVFIKIFLHVSHVLGYVASKYESAPTQRKQHSSAHLCLEFLKFCSTLRFYNPYDISEVLPCPELYSRPITGGAAECNFKYNKLAKCAIVHYHTFALSGNLQALDFDKETERGMVKMKHFYLYSGVFRSSPISKDELKRAKETLIKYSRVKELTLREVTQIKKVCVNAEGTLQATKLLRSLSRKKTPFLRDLFLFGFMPAKNKTHLRI